MMRWIWPVLGLMGCALQAEAACPTAAAEFSTIVDAAEADPVPERRAEVEVAMTCLQTIPARPDLARAYVVVGTQLYERTERIPLAASYFCAARSADDALVLLPTLVPEDDGHPLRRAWQSSCAFRSEPVRTPVDTWVDGREIGMVPGLPAVRPYLIQYQLEDGTWRSQVVPPDGFPDLPPEPLKRRERWVAPTIGGIALVGLAIGAWYGLSINGRNDGSED